MIDPAELATATGLRNTEGLWSVDEKKFTEALKKAWAIGYADGIRSSRDEIEGLKLGLQMQQDELERMKK